ncbi:hypothetical protein [Komagataeibacter sp. FNDCR2]|uniref:hypothetical protein n=1 Tax=Komagataeibacter sp. FNDCR2 TaxID=2878682 RepID=UPI001E47A022|nr:hypothetical protein [Komagataeibacter sp. FNDCR2]MCE2575542.1 hypothetical protein [Komagataeibacter sp. FNDCR2]
MDMHTPRDATLPESHFENIHIRLSLHHDRIGHDGALPAASRKMAAGGSVRRRPRALPLLVLALVLASQGLGGCKRHNETVGEKIDHFGDKVQDSIDPPKGPAEKAGRSIDRTLHND